LVRPFCTALSKSGSGLTRLSNQVSSLAMSLLPNPKLKLPPPDAVSDTLN